MSDIKVFWEAQAGIHPCLCYNGRSLCGAFR
jgi:hypothetical protein